MRITKLHLFTALALVVWIVLAWLIGTWLKLTGLDLWLLRGGLILIGVVGAVGFLWLRHKEEGGASAFRAGIERSGRGVPRGGCPFAVAGSPCRSESLTSLLSLDRRR